jgi:hypothetical protein
MGPRKLWAFGREYHAGIAVDPARRNEMVAREESGLLPPDVAESAGFEARGVDGFHTERYPIRRQRKSGLAALDAHFSKSRSGAPELVAIETAGPLTLSRDDR